MRSKSSHRETAELLDPDIFASAVRDLAARAHALGKGPERSSWQRAALRLRLESLEQDAAQRNAVEIRDWLTSLLKHLNKRSHR